MAKHGVFGVFVDLRLVFYVLRPVCVPDMHGSVAKREERGRQRRQRSDDSGTQTKLRLLGASSDHQTRCTQKNDADVYVEVPQPLTYTLPEGGQSFLVVVVGRRNGRHHQCLRVAAQATGGELSTMQHSERYWCKN